TGNTVTATTGNNAIAATAGGNSLTASAANTLTAGTSNTITGGTGNTVTATTGNNAIAATAGGNSLTASAANTLTAGTSNTITGGTGNTVTATTGNNAIAATAGSNSLSANAANQSNSISAIGTSGVNNLTANATTGANNIEAKTNNVGFATAGSNNNIGNANSSVNVMQGLSTTISSYNGGVKTNNSIVVSETKTADVGANHVEFGTLVTGGMYVEGSLGVNGDVYSLNPAGNVALTVANNGMSISGTSNSVSLTSDSNASTADAHTQLDLQPGSATLLVNTDSGVAHGVAINQTQTVLSGGTHSTSVTLDDDGAKFRNDTTGSAVRVSGVADGANDFDAVNFRQMRTAYSGVASVAALAAIPNPAPGKTFSMGIGYGNFQGESAVAAGIKASIPDRNISMVAGMGWSREKYTVSLGLGVSF
ncbi:MAG: YadA-like family protein, partial [Spirochaetota bacterium]